MVVTKDYNNSLRDALMAAPADVADLCSSDLQDMLAHEPVVVNNPTSPRSRRSSRTMC